MTAPHEDQSFTDRMVREDYARLHAVALRYLATYTGNFDVVIAAKQAIDEGHELNVSEIRTVLNALRSDTSVRLKYTARPGSNVIDLGGFPSRDKFVEEWAPPTRRINFDDPDHHLGRREAPRWRLLKRFKIKLHYGMSAHKRSEVIHLVSPGRTECHYYPIGSHYDGEKVYGDPVWEFRVKFECTADTFKKRLRLLTDDQAVTLVAYEMMRWCRWCHQLREARDPELGHDDR